MLVLYWFLPAFYITLRRKTITNGGSNSINAIFLGTFYVLSHSVGPLISCAKWTKSLIFKEKVNKVKTANL